MYMTLNRKKGIKMLADKCQIPPEDAGPGALFPGKHIKHHYYTETGPVCYSTTVLLFSRLGFSQCAQKTGEATQLPLNPAFRTTFDFLTIDQGRKIIGLAVK